MKRTKSLLLVTVIVACGLIVSFISSTYAVEKTYEVNTGYSLPEYRTDTARAIDAYQQMVNRLLDAGERNNAIVIAKLDAIQRQLQSLSVRIEKIENALTPSGKNAAEHKKPDPNLPAPEPMKQN